MSTYERFILRRQSPRREKSAAAPAVVATKFHALSLHDKNQEHQHLVVPEKPQQIRQNEKVLMNDTISSHAWNPCHSNG